MPPRKPRHIKRTRLLLSRAGIWWHHCHVPNPGHAELHAQAKADAVATAITALRAAGYRITESRRAVLELLAEHPEYLSADEVAALLPNSEAHRATVYRTLETLVKTGVVTHRHSPGDVSSFHLSSPDVAHGHLHAHCATCGRVLPLPVDVFDDATARIRTQWGFAVDIRRCTLVGYCKDCAPESAAHPAEQPAH